MYKWFLIAIAIALEFIVLLGVTNVLGVPNINAWQAAAFISFFASFLYFPFWR